MKPFTITIIFLVFHLISFGQNRCMIRVDGKYGFIDTLGNIKIDPIYDQATQFSENYAVVTINGQSGYIDTSGQIVIPLQFEIATQFTNGVAVVGFDGKFGLIDTYGNSIVTCQYDWITPALINDARVGFKQDERWGYMNLKGEIVIHNKYESISMFHNGTARVRINGKYGMIDTTGKYILEPYYISITGSSFYDNRVGVLMADKKKHQYLDMNGTPVTDPIFYQTGTFSEGAAFVKEKYNEPGYYIDTLGNKLFSGTFEYGGWFKNGFAAVQQDGKYGIIDKKGNFLIPPSLDGISVFNECRFFVYWKMKRGKIHYGLINLKGEFITRPIYSSTLINDGDCIFPELYYKGKDSYDYSTKLGYVNRQGKVIWKPKN